MKKIRWGILGTGRIAKTFAKALKVLPDAEIVAVGSRAQATADAFGDEFGISTRHATYEKLAADPAVDVVYISSPHPCHKDNSLLCLDHGKAVLCEKPFCINAGEAEAVVAAARAKRLFLMEAMWTRFIPATLRVREMIRAGKIGEVRVVKADLGFRAGWTPEGRLLNPALGGGALLDVGVYTVAWASMVFGGRPGEMHALTHIGETGVDEQTAMVFRYTGGGLALLSCAVRANVLHESLICGTEGQIRVHHPFWHAAKLTLIAGGKEEEIPLPYEHNGYQYEAIEVMRCLREGRTESEQIPLDESLAIMRTLDAVRAQIGLKYPME